MNSSKPGKTCISCGLPKPTSAFLEISGPQGTHYGNICATCRGATASQKIIIPAETDSTERGASGYRIDNKAKVYIDKEKHKVQAHKEEEKHRHRLDTEEKLVDTTEKSQQKNFLERKHREEYIASPKSFLNQRPATINVEKKLITHAAVIQAQTNINLRQGEAAKKIENLVKTTDFSASFWDPAIAGGIKDTSPEFLRIRAWLGESAAANRFRNIYSPAGSPEVNANAKRPASVSQIANNTTEQKPSTSTPKASALSTFSKTFGAQPNQPSKSPMIDFIQEKWDPSSPGSRKR